MRLARNDPPFLGLPVHFESTLPPSGVLEGRVSPLFASLGRADLGARVLENGNTIAAHLGREIATTVGWPDDELDGLGALVSTAFERVGAPSVEVVIETLGREIPEVLSTLERSVTETISGVPLLGWLVRLGLLVWDVVSVAREKAPKIANAPALGYDQADDSFATDGLLARTAGNDWTALFLPPPGGFLTTDLAYTASGVADGFGWGQIGAVSERLGLVPGVGQIAGFWQSSRRMAGSSRDAGVESIVSGNRLYPSATSFAALTWANAQKPGAPTVGAIDLDKVADAWADYGERLASFADAQSEWRAKQVRNGWRWTDEHTGAALYGVARDDVPKPWRDVWGLEGLIGWRVGIAREHVRKSLATLSCAYMGPETPALRDAALRERWALMRERLLRHEARADVDLELVPDAAYRSALAAARKGAGLRFTTPVVPKEKPPRMPVPTVDGSPEPPEPEPPSLPDPPGWPSDNDQGAGGLAAGALGIVLTLAMARALR